MRRRIGERRHTHTKIMTCLVLFLAAIIFGITIFLHPYEGSRIPTDDNVVGINWRAGLFDAMYYLRPNEDFILEATQMLEENGFVVDSFFGEQVTAKLLLALPANYNLLILRLHSALAENGKLYFFSGEAYSQYGYYYEQLSELVSKGNIPNASSYFSVALDALAINKKESLNNSVIVAMGCHTLCDDFSLESLKKSVDIEVYVGWDSGVDLSRSDQSVLYFLGDFVEKGVTLKKAVETTMTKIGQDPKYGSILGYFPESKGNSTITDLIHNDASSASELHSQFFVFAFTPKCTGSAVMMCQRRTKEHHYPLFLTFS